MSEGSDPPGAQPKSVRRSPRLSPGVNKSGGKKGSIQEAKRKGKMEKNKGKPEDELNLKLHQLDLSNRAAATGTGLVYTEAFTQHKNLWDTSHPECPDRVSTIMGELESQNLLSPCVRVQPREATEEELLLVHSKQYINLIKSTQSMKEDELKQLSDQYDSVYIHPESFKVASLAVGSVLQLVDQVMSSQLRNGFALVRPPGHHAQPGTANGYCLFNNVAIAARYAQTRHDVKRVLIVDWDVHHGQGIQYVFQEDPSVLYFSVHRFEDGGFWPHLPESGCKFVGSGRAEGKNINLPWDQKSMGDADYIAAFQQLLLPVAYEFQPQLVLVSAGFDAALGDEKGEMSVLPQCYHILTHMLMGMAEGRLILALEGGYNLSATAQGASACVRALLGGVCPPLSTPSAPCDSALRSISETISAQFAHWAWLQVLQGGVQKCGAARATSTETSVVDSNLSPSVFTTTGLVYDERMMEHENMWDRHHPEQPQRISKIFSKHEKLGLVSRCLRIPARLATEEELAMCHTVKHVQQMKETSTMKPRDLYKLGETFNSIFLSNQSYNSACLAAGSCFTAVEKILRGEVNNGVAIVRPPGHHAEKKSACGFCLFNTVALAARHAQKTSQHTRVLILDWDVHHGNGTQHMFEDDDSILYISLHRYDNGSFFPSSEDAAADRVGVGKGAGYNVNVAWSGGRMGDSDYITAFLHVVMPIATEFNPDLVLVSAGFDAARGDPLGGYNVTPEGYAHLTHMLMSLAGGRILIVLEGGYNLTSISDSMAMCTSVLLGDPPPGLVTPLPPPHHCAVTTINQVIQHHAPYWKSLRIQIPEAVIESVSSPMHRGKRESLGKGRRSGRVSSHKPSQEDTSLEQLTQGLATLDLDKSLTAPPLDNIGDSKSPDKIKSETQQKEDSADVSQSPTSTPTVAMATPPETEAATGVEAEPEGACGWSKGTMELTCAAEMDGATMFVVDPLSWCPHLEAVKPLPSSGVDVFQSCQECGSGAENWICLTCYQVFCGRYVNEHMVVHGVTSEHPLVLSFCDLSVWCYQCEAYVHNQALFEVKNSAHRGKFGEEIPPWS